MNLLQISFSCLDLFQASFGPYSIVDMTCPCSSNETLSTCYLHLSLSLSLTLLLSHTPTHSLALSLSYSLSLGLLLSPTHIHAKLNTLKHLGGCTFEWLFTISFHVYTSTITFTHIHTHLHTYTSMHAHTYRHARYSPNTKVFLLSLRNRLQNYLSLSLPPLLSLPFTCFLDSYSYKLSTKYKN